MAFRTPTSAHFGDCSNGDRQVSNSSGSCDVLHAHINSRVARIVACSANERLAAPESDVMFLDGTHDDQFAQANDHDGDSELTSSPDKNNDVPKDDSDSDYVESPEDKKKKKKKKKQCKQETRKRTSGNMSGGPTTPGPKRSKPFVFTTPSLNPGSRQNAQFQLDPANAGSPSSYTMSPGTMVETPRSINKSGQPRKEREPRGKLMKWNDTDWRRTVLSIVSVCGERGIEIPFEKVARSINETLTGTAFQQALLKLRSRMIDDGHTIPSLKMKWTKKDGDNDTIAASLAGDSGGGDSVSTTPNPKPKETVKVVWRTPPRKPTKDQEIQTSICKVKISLPTQQSLGDGRVKSKADVQDTPTRSKDIQKSISAVLPVTPVRPVQPILNPPPLRTRRSRQRKNICNNVSNNISNVSEQSLSSMNTSPMQSTSMGPVRDHSANFATTFGATQLANVEDITLQDPFGQNWNFQLSPRDYSFPPLQVASSGNVGIEGTAFGGLSHYYHLPGMQTPLSGQNSCYSQSIDNLPTTVPTNGLPQIGNCRELAVSNGSLQNNALTMGLNDQLLPLFPDPINGMAAAGDNRVSIGDNALAMDNQLVSDNYGQRLDSLEPLCDYDGDHKPQISDQVTEKTPSFSNPQAALIAAYSTEDDADTGDCGPTLYAPTTNAPGYRTMSAANVTSQVQASDPDAPKLGSPFKYKPGMFSNARVDDYSDDVFGCTSFSLGDDTVSYDSYPRVSLGGFFDQQPPRVSPNPVSGWEMQTLDAQQMGNGMVRESAEGEVEMVNDTFFLE